MNLMNKLCAFTAAAAVSLCGVPAVCGNIHDSITACAEEETEELIDNASGIHYSVINGTAVVTGCEESVKALNIPAQLNGIPVTAIGKTAFEGNNNLQTVTIAEGITTIEKGAFQYCRFITAVKLPSTLTYIGASAFDMCTRLAEINIPSGITVINERTFRGCEFEEFELPEGVTEIRESAFESNNNLLAVDIPSTVSVIGKNAFSYCQMLQFAVIPYGVVSISEGAFDGCSNMKEVYLPESLLYIEKNAFDYCRALKEIQLPDSLISIDDHAFGDTGITNFVIPDSVEYLGAFAYPNNAATETVDGVKYIGKWAVGCESSGQTDFKIREGTVGIAEFAFTSLYNNKANIEIPSTLKYICQPAFYDSNNVTLTVADDNPDICAVDSVIFSKDMTKLLLYPQSKKDESYTIPNTVVEICENAFQYCKSLKTVTIPDSVKYIDAHAFENCSGLTELTLPDGLAEIGEYAFSGLKGLEYSYPMDIPDSVTSIGYCAFSGSNCYRTKDDNIEMVDDWIVSHGTSYNKVLNIELNVRGIADQAFNNTDFSEIILPDSVEYIGKYAFKDSADLEKIKLSENLISIDNNAFAGCQALNTPEIPDSVVHIGASAFEDCFTALEEINGVKYVDSWAIDSDRTIKTAELRDGTRGIADMTFYGCTDLVSVKLPESLAIVDMGAFAYCISLEEIEIPANTQYIDYGAFAGCEALSKITVSSPSCLIYYDADTIAADAVIYGYTNSSAEIYAALFDRKFVAIGEIERVRGDVNADGTFSIADLVMMQDWLLGKGAIIDPLAGDLYEDSVINIYDMCIMRNEILSISNN